MCVGVWLFVCVSDIYMCVCLVWLCMTVCSCVNVCDCVCVLCGVQESSYCYWPGEEGEQMVSGRLKVRLVRVRGHGDILERKLEVTGSDSFSTDILTVKMIQLTSWPLQELPHPAGIMSLIEKLNYVLMRSSSKQTVVMCR